MRRSAATASSTAPAPGKADAQYSRQPGAHCHQANTLRATMQQNGSHSHMRSTSARRTALCSAAAAVFPGRTTQRWLQPPDLRCNHATAPSPVTGRCSPLLLHKSQRPAVAAAAAAAATASWDHAAPVAPSWLQSLRRVVASVLTTKYDAEIATIAIPALCAMMLEPCLYAINAAMIGHLGTQQLSAVSMGSLSITFATFLFSFLLFLTTPLVAEAVAKKDDAKVSRVAADGFWLAGGFGLITAAVMMLCSPAIVQGLRPPEPAVALYATQYMCARAPGILAASVQFVATGTYRGFRDTKTPLFISIGTAICSLGLNYLLIYGLNLGVLGSGLATSLAQFVSCISLCYLMVRTGKLRLGDLLTPPAVATVAPLMRSGVVLGARNMVGFGLIVYGSTLCVRAGAVCQASFEVLKLVYMLTAQLFECLNVSTQTLCASYLGSDDIESAQAVFRRLLFLATVTGMASGIVVFAAQLPIVSFFTKDAEVVRQVLGTLPMICCMMMFDAAASINDGALLAARQTNFYSFIQIGGCTFQYLGLAYLAHLGHANLFVVWACIKSMSIVRLFGGLHRHFVSKKSAYRRLAGHRTAAVVPGGAGIASSEAVVPAAAVAVGPESTAALPPVPTSSPTAVAAAQPRLLYDSNGTGRRAGADVSTHAEVAAAHSATAVYNSGSSGANGHHHMNGREAGSTMPFQQGSADVAAAASHHHTNGHIVSVAAAEQHGAVNLAAAAPALGELMLDVPVELELAGTPVLVVDNVAPKVHAAV